MPSKKIIKIKLDEQNKAKKKFDINCTLSDARIELKKVINTQFLFLDNEKFVIDKELESEQKICNI